MKKLLILSFSALFALSACNTVSGFGKDVQAAGAGLENAAESVSSNK